MVVVVMVVVVKVEAASVEGGLGVWASSELESSVVVLWAQVGLSVAMAVSLACPLGESGESQASAMAMELLVRML